MLNWAEVGRVLANGGPIGVPTNALLFDTQNDLLWTGSALGIVASHYGPTLQRYTSWHAHTPFTAAGRHSDQTASNNAGVKGILCDDRAVYSVGGNGIKASNRRGVGRWNIFSSQTEMPSLNMSSICFSPSSSSDVIVGGASTGATSTGQLGKDDVIFSLNTGTGGVIRKSASEAQIVQMRKSTRYICAGSADGHIQLRDPRSLHIEHRLHAHPGGLIDVQADGNQLYSIGWTMRLGHPVPEPTVKVHDLRTLRALVPIPFSSSGGPALLAIHPKRSSTVIVAAPSGQFQIVDINNLGDATFNQVAVSSYLTSMAMSPSSDFLAFGEADGSVRLWASGEEASHFTSFSTSNALETPDVPETIEPVNWTIETSLANVGMPFYDEQLLSALPYDQYASDASPLFNPPKKIDASVLSSIRTVDKVSYAPLPRHLRSKRNMIEGAGPRGVSAGALARSKDRRRLDERRTGAPMFRSEKEAAKRLANGSSTPEEMPLSPAGQQGNGSMPAYYGVKTIEYSKFGVEDFDFEFYNHTSYSGLETHIENSYANAYLQALHYLVPFRAVAKSHAMSSAPIDPTVSGGCQKDNCLLCHTGFLSRMLEDAKGANCQATNVLRALSASERAATLGLMDKDDSSNADISFSNLIQTFNRFMLETVSAEARGAAKPATLEAEVMNKLFTHTQMTKHVCGSCGHVNSRESGSNVVDLIYPRKALSNELAPASDFASVLRASLLRETVTKTTCRSCRTQAATIRSRRVVLDNNHLPQALSVNCAVNTGEQLRYWTDGAHAGGSYLPPKIAIGSEGDALVTQELRSEEDEARAKEQGMATYALRSIVVNIHAQDDKEHLVSLINMAGNDDAKENTKQWYLFNDFLVRSVPQEEALSFPASWKVPAVLIWERVDRSVFDVEQLPQAADLHLLCVDENLSKRRDPALQRHVPLSDVEIPLERGTIVAIDSEFVALQQEELELSSTGTRKLIRPSRLSLARVSVLRGQGNEEGKAFVDDFIWTKDMVMDYLTQFSGIKQGDLDPATSKHTLVPLRVAYKKLRMLVDAGCRFLGHGLKKDFRIINIYVPPEQVIDTVDLFQSTLHPRKLSLRFLAWFLLKEDIQGPQAVVDVQTVQAGEGTAKDSVTTTSAVVASSEGHDSIEDALAALRLYRLYLSFERDNRLEDVLEDLYEAGRIHGWKPPARPSASST